MQRFVIAVCSLVLIFAVAVAAEVSRVEPGKPLPRGLSCEEPVPGRSDGRLYYFVPQSIDFTKPVPLFIFLHGGGDSTPPEFIDSNYLNEKTGGLRPHIDRASFLVVAPSAPLPKDPKTPNWARWNQDCAAAQIDALIDALAARFPIDRDRIILGGTSMGGFGTLDLGQRIADRFAGIWISAGSWSVTDFRTFCGTPIYLQHGKYDTAHGYRSGKRARSLYATGVFYSRGADRLMRRDGVEHVYDEHEGGHALTWEPAQLATRRFLVWAAKQRRNPYPPKAVLVTACGENVVKNPHSVTRARWLEVIDTVPGKIEFDRIHLTGPKYAETLDDYLRQGFRLSRISRPGARIVAENLGGNRFRVELENVSAFRILLAPPMGDITKPFSVDMGKAGTRVLIPEPLTGNRDYSAVLTVRLLPPPVPAR